MADSAWGLCKDCKWWQIEPKAAVQNLTMGLCIDEKLQPFLLRVSGNSGCNVFMPGKPAMPRDRAKRRPAPSRSGRQDRSSCSVGKGNLAPWNPMQRLMVQGVYRHVRNPMISGVFFVLFGEASLPVFCWFVIFVIGNAVYIPLTKEPRLVKRFGDEYLTYKQNVPRWIPTFRPWWDLASAGWAARFGDLRPIRRREVG